MKAIVLAGGQGVRLQPYTRVLPKPLIPLDDLPILQIILLQLRQAGITHVTLALYYKAQQIEHYFGDGCWLGLEIDYSRSAIPLGTAGPLSLVPAFDQPCLVMNADILTTIDFATVFAFHKQNNAIATIVTHQHTVDIRFGVVDVDDQQRVCGYVEKPKLTYLVNSGIYVLDPAVLKHIPPHTYMDMPALLRQLLTCGHTVKCYRFTGEWFDIGTLEQYEQAQEAFRGNRARYLRGAEIGEALLEQELEPDQLGLEVPFSSPGDRTVMTLLWR